MNATVSRELRSDDVPLHAITPARLSASTRSGSDAASGTSRATGRPYSVTTIVLPAFTSRTHSLSVAALVAELNSAANDRRPSVRFDGLEVFFDSDRIGPDADLWTSSRDNVSELWSTPVNLGASVNSASDDIQPFIGAERQTLIFASNRPGGFGGFDLYVTTRAKLHER